MAPDLPVRSAVMRWHGLVSMKTDITTKWEGETESYDDQRDGGQPVIVHFYPTFEFGYLFVQS